ncbi:hypothetical protein HII13_001897 [Brettanomyces bruxellensis]|uniref:Phosphotransferase n=1 Tax=Dekkera bruxellensis TaxID=5007 RepID=A0A3F2YAF6_DEKBR|nr:hypothetical protein HII12_004726 [Brettanomyces bruxellensis]KAF6012094.1 hypothetical protein HII13_001897 [Brettanomyces bruxellensis]VUG17152.1 DEBR0S1_34398g1_1 [Brettanomyces bruxellensis]
MSHVQIMQKRICEKAIESSDSVSEALFEESELSSCSNPSSSIEDDAQPQNSLSEALKSITESFSEKHVSSFANKLYGELLQAFTTNSDRTLIKTKAPIPTTNEKGRFLVIDLGGSTFKVFVVDLLGDCKAAIVSGKVWNIENDKKTIDRGFFRLMCDHIQELLNTGTYFDITRKIPTAISWSFPVVQTRPNNGCISDVTKGYTLAEDIKGQDLGIIFSKMMMVNNNVQLEVDSIVNDAVSVYLAGLYVHKCHLGLVLGTGLNASFPIKSHLYNSELSFFGTSFLPSLTHNLIDETMCPDVAFIAPDNYISSKSPVYQPLEYMCAGRYLGEMFRLGLVIGALNREIFQDQITQFNRNEILVTPYGLSSKIISELSEADYSIACGIFKIKFGLILTSNDYTMINSLVEVLTNRAAIILSASILACMKFISKLSSKKDVNLREQCRLVYVGSLLHHYKKYLTKVQSILDRYHIDVGLQKFDMKHMDDSSIIGAAVSAATFVTMEHM